MRSAFLLAIAVTTVVIAPGHAVEPDVRDTLRGAITCTGNPLAQVRGLVDGGSNFTKGYAVTQFGEGIDHTAVVIVRTPIQIAGATSDTVFATGEPQHEGFAGLVYARFTGDAQRVVRELRLAAPAAGTDVAIGKYERRLTVAVDGEKNPRCPMTIALTPVSDREFLLGCGWCPG